jgi:hypothetical protein
VSDIRAGDLVMVVRGMTCCGGDTESLGKTFVVSDIYSFQGFCMDCDAPQSGCAADGNADDGFEVDRLKRIPPLDELESPYYDFEDDDFGMN